jgi:hypothetical protein
MNSSQILKYDPLVSDTACHTRACYQVFLARKSRTASLSTEEESYLEALDLLTQTQSRKQDVFGVITDERTDISQIPPKYLPASASNGKKNTLLAKAKSEVAKATLKFLQQGCNELVLNGDPEIFTFSIPTYSQRIPVLPLYVSAKMMLHYASKQAIPLVVNLRRLSLREGNYLLDGAMSLTYAFNTEKRQFTPQEVKENEAAIAIDMFSCYVPGTEAEVSGFLTSSTFQAFVESFQKEDIAALVMLAAVGHPAFPPSAEPPKLAKPVAMPYKDAGPVKELVEVKAAPPAKEASPEAVAGKMVSSPPSVASEVKALGGAPLQVSLNECSETEFIQLSTLARNYGFFRPKAQYVSIDRKAGKLLRTTACLPFFIDHVRASTVGACQAATAQLVADRAKLKAPQEEALELDKSKGKGL